MCMQIFAKIRRSFTFGAVLCGIKMRPHMIKENFGTMAIFSVFSAWPRSCFIGITN
jgi:hypothetical protein